MKMEEQAVLFINLFWAHGLGWVLNHGHYRVFSLFFWTPLKRCIATTVGLFQRTDLKRRFRPVDNEVDRAFEVEHVHLDIQIRPELIEKCERDSMICSGSLSDGQWFPARVVIDRHPGELDLVSRDVVEHR